MTTATRTRPAHERVTARDANMLMHRDGIDWPVSGDESRRAHGYIGLRNAGKPGLWHRVAMHAILNDPFITEETNQ